MATSTDYLGPSDALRNISLEEYALRERKLVRKLDMRVMPCFFFMIGLNYLNRNALPNAEVMGISEDLGLKGSQINTAISVFFAGYLTLQVPSNILLTKVRPSVYLGCCMIAWGIASGMTSIVHNFTGLVITRLFLGALEAPFFSGALFLLSSLYTQKELAFRTSILYSGALLATGFGALVGAGVQQGLDGARGIASWRWLFIIEAAVTVVFGFISIFALPDYAHTTKWLTPEERVLAVQRLQAVNFFENTEQGSSWLGFRMAITDYKVWLLAVIILMKSAVAGIALFIPTLVKTLELPRTETLLLVAPPFIFTTFVSLVVSYTSDKYSERSYHIVATILVAMVGLVILLTTMSVAARYTALFIVLGGVFGSYNVALAWISGIIPQPAVKRSSAIALVNTVGSVASIFSPYLYLQKDGPRFLEAMVANMCFCVVVLVVALFLQWCLTTENKNLERREIQIESSGASTIVESSESREIEAKG